MTDIPRPIDTPDRWDTGMEPPYNKRVRHGKMTRAAEVTLRSMAILTVIGALGALVAYISEVIS